MENYDLIYEGIQMILRNINANKKNPTNKKNELQILGILITESMLFNLYTKHKNLERSKINSILYSQSASSFSKIVSETPNNELIKFINFFEKLVSSSDFFNEIRDILNDIHINKECIHSNLSILMNTLEWVIEKENISCNSFKQKKNSLTKV